MPSGPVHEWAGQLRAVYDPTAARNSPPHLTITQPFRMAPSAKDLVTIARVVAAFGDFQATLGPAIASPNGRMVWLDAQPRERILELRERLHDTGLFNTDIAFTIGFLPHLTISEEVRNADEVERIIERLNADRSRWDLTFDRLSWSVPTDEFVFEERLSFPLVQSPAS